MDDQEKHQRKRLADLRIEESNNQQVRKKTGMIKVVFFILLILDLDGANSQRVLYSTKRLKVHAIKDTKNDAIIEKTVQDVIDFILAQTSKTALEQKGITQAYLLKEMRDDWKGIMTDMLNEFDFDENIFEKNTTRHKNGIPFIGRAMHYLFDIPGPDQYHGLKELAEKTLLLAENEQHEVEGIKKTIIHDHETITKLTHSLNKQLNLSLNISNELQEEQEIIHKGIDIDTMFFHAVTLLNHANFENLKRKDIFSKAEKHCPSLYMFPKKYINKIVKSAIVRDKTLVPIFVTKEEVHEMYLFQCTFTTYNDQSKKFTSVMEIPLTVYSEKMDTIEIPNFQTKELNKLKGLEIASGSKIDRFLCSERSTAIRFLSFNSLKKCQKNVRSNLYVCSDREVLMKYDDYVDCDKIESLPKTLVIEKNRNEYFIDNEMETLTIFCTNENPRKVLKPEIGPVKINIPNHCYLKSKSLWISRLHENSDAESDASIENKEDEIRVIKMNPSNWKPFEADVSNTHINETESDPIEHINDYESKIKSNLKEAKKQLKKLDDGDNYSEFVIPSLCLAILTMMGLVGISAYVITKTRSKMIPHSNDNSICNSKFDEYENRLGQIKRDIEQDRQKRIKKKAEITKVLEDFHKSENMVENDNYVKMMQIVRDFYDN